MVKREENCYMSEQWNWDEPQIPRDDENKTLQDETVVESAADEKDMKSTMEEDQSAKETAQENSVANEGTYHWVNPEYQKRQSYTGNDNQNTYDNNNYRESVGGSWRATENNTAYTGQQSQANQEYQSETQSTSQGYTGGSYKDWRSQQTANESIPTGQRQYGNYSYQQNEDVKPAKTKKEKKSSGFGKKLATTIGLAVIFGVVAGGVMFGVNSLGNKLTGQTQEEAVQIPTTSTPAAESQTQEVTASASSAFTVAEVAQNCMPSVVSITNASVQTVQSWFGGSQQYESESSGSGIIVGQNEKELLIATNKHVVEGADTITVAFCDDSAYEAQIKGKSTENDLAVIAVKLDNVTAETLSAIKIIALGDSDAVQIGEQVVAIGNALGYGQSVTSGWISAVNRELTDENGDSTGNLIQTDAAINPGNSGGALLNMRGELIGINSAKYADTAVEGMGYAIPIAIAEPILDELMNRETRYKVDDETKSAYIGVTCMNVESSAAQMYGIPEGAFVSSVEEGGPAQKAGIQKGDVITKFDGIGISGSSELVETLTYYEAGEEVEVVICRAENGEYVEHTLSVTLGKKSQMTQKIE